MCIAIATYATSRSIFATSISNNCNIPPKHLKHLKHMLATCAFNKKLAGGWPSGQDGSHDRGSATSTPRGGVSVRRPNETDTRDLSLSFFYPSSVPLKEIRAFIFFLSIEIEILKQKSPLSRVQATFWTNIPILLLATELNWRILVFFIFFV
jgi:hypothetical protein